MDVIPADGASLSATALGRVESPPLAMLHGLVSGNMATWYTAFGLPLSARRRVLLYDQRGHGDSTLPGNGFDLASQARDLDTVLAFYGYGAAPVDLVGHSMGALIALRFALDHPGRIRRLVLVDAPMPASEYVAPSLHGLLVDVALPPPEGGTRGRRRDRFLRRMQTLLSETTLLQDVSAMQAEPRARLSHFARPVLLCYGTQSPCREAGIYLRGAMPRAELHWLDAGHELPAQTPHRLLQLIEVFLDQPDLPADLPNVHIETV